MKRLWIGLAVITLVFLASCRHSTPFTDAPVGISSCSTGADPTLSIGAGNQINWTAQDNDYTVIFPNPGTNPAPGTPFQSGGVPRFNFQIPRGTTVNSGGAHLPTGYYKYSIYTGLLSGMPPAGTQPCKDPGLHVKD